MLTFSHCRDKLPPVGGGDFPDPDDGNSGSDDHHSEESEEEESGEDEVLSRKFLVFPSFASPSF